MGLYTVLKKHLLPGEPPLLCPNSSLLSTGTTIRVCLCNSHSTRDAAPSLGQRETWESTGHARLQRDPLLYQIIQPMK